MPVCVLPVQDSFDWLECYTISSMNTLIRYCLGLSAIILAFKPALAEESPRLKIVTDIPFVSSLVRDIAGEEHQVFGLITTANSPHEFALRPRALSAIQNADLLVTIGPQLLPSINTAINDASNARLLNLFDAPNIEIIFLTDGEGHHAHREEGKKEQEEEHAKDLTEDSTDQHANVDPHIWTDPINVQIMAAAIRDELVALNPSSKNVFTENTQRVIEQLQQFHEAQTLRAATSTITFITLHDNVRYFAERYGLVSKGTLLASSHAPTSARHLKKLQQLLRSDKVSCVITDPNTNPRWTQTLTEGVDIPLLEVDILGTSTDDAHYLSLLTKLSDAFSECIR